MIAERHLAKTASPISVTGTPYSKAAMPVHFPVPFWPAVSRILGRRYLPAHTIQTVIEF